MEHPHGCTHTVHAAVGTMSALSHCHVCAVTHCCDPIVGVSLNMSMLRLLGLDTP